MAGLLVTDGPCSDADPDVFFPEETNMRAFDPARAICRHCPVATWWSCLLDNLDESHGVYGSQSPKDRRRYKKKGFVHARQVARQRPEAAPPRQLAGARA
jgi:hypothetical protein